MKGIRFSSDPVFDASVKMLIIAPAGARFEAATIGDHMYGTAKWRFAEPPLQHRAPRRVPRELIETPAFRYRALDIEWSVFLDDIFETMDFVFFFNFETRILHEVSHEALLEQNPDNYAFTFLEIESLQPQPVRSQTMADDRVTAAVTMLNQLKEAGWSMAAISKASGVNQITLGNIKNGKATRITDKVFLRIEGFKKQVDAGGTAPAKSAADAPKAAPKAAPAKTGKPRGPKPGAKKAAAAPASLINPNYVSVDLTQLQGMIDGLIVNFADAIERLKDVKKMLK